MRTTWLLLCFVLPAVARGQAVRDTAAPSPPVTAGATGAFLALSVADMEASARWYAETLGLRVTMRAPKQNGAAVTVLEGDGLIVELIQNDAARPLAQAAPATAGNNILVHGLVKAGVIVPDFERTMATLRARRAEIAYGPFPARSGQRANVIVRDNAGNLIQFFGR